MGAKAYLPHAAIARADFWPAAIFPWINPLQLLVSVALWRLSLLADAASLPRHWLRARSLLRMQTR